MQEADIRSPFIAFFDAMYTKMLLKITQPNDNNNNLIKRL